MEKQNKRAHQIHEFAPVYDENSKVLILGTFPSVKSRENQFYYGHPQNRFWKLIAAICNCEVPMTIEDKKSMLLDNGIAIWDVISSCDIEGSSDSSIKNVVPSDLSTVLSHCHIRKIYANGNAAKKLYEKYAMPKTGIQIIGLPSTSPANAAYSLDQLVMHWSCMKEELTD